MLSFSELGVSVSSAGFVYHSCLGFMNPSQATAKFLESGVLLCLDAPTDSTLQFGIDTNSWVTGPQFKGIKLIPPGLHYVFYR